MAASPGLPLPRIILAVLTLCAASCSSIKARLEHPLAKPVDAALRSAKVVWQELPAGGETPAIQRLQWRLALDGVLKTLEREGPPRTWTGTQSIQGWTVTFAGDAGGIQSVPPAWCDRITPIRKVKSLPGIRGNRLAGEGVGLPVVMHQPRIEGAGDPFVPPNGRHFPATLTAEFTSDRAVTLTFHHTRNTRTAKIRRVERPLAYDVSAAISAGMDPAYYRKYSLRGLLRPDLYVKEAGIYAPEPYDPRKIPVVLVHGIESAPHIWGNVMNEMASDPGLRDRCQAWFFLYPTGLSIHSAAARLRQTLTAARNYYDPRHRDAGMNNMALVGHSMGGLLSKMQIMDSGDDLHRAFWTKPLAELPIDKAARDLVGHTLHFKHLPFVTRAVFITTPHRGSKIVDISIMRWVFKLVRPATAVAGILKQIASAAHGAVNPELKRFQTFGVRSNEGLSPYHPMLSAMNKRPLLAKYDSIIASFPPLSRNKPLEDTTDGVVPYQSAWLSGAESTATITGFHTCIPSPALSKALLPVLRRHARLK
jgi:hypothetical protein